MSKIKDVVIDEMNQLRELELMEASVGNHIIDDHEGGQPTDACDSAVE